MRQVEKTLGRKPKELSDAPKIRVELVYLWDIFIALNVSTGGQISYRDIEAYSHCNGDLSSFEVDVIMSINALGRARS